MFPTDIQKRIEAIVTNGLLFEQMQPYVVFPMNYSDLRLHLLQMNLRNPEQIEILTKYKFRKSPKSQQLVTLSSV